MSNIIDARGLSCPQPVIMTMNKMKGLGEGEIVILVDTDTAKENVSRATESKGWEITSIEPEENGYKIIARKGI